MRALLLSGGIESSALGYWQRPDLSVTIDYGQPAAAGELKAAKGFCSLLGIEHLCLTTDAYRQPCQPNTQATRSSWWPYRNQLLVTVTAIALIDRSLSEIQIGLVADDIYRDCTPSFVKAVNQLFEQQERKVAVTAPAVALSTMELLRRSRMPRELLGLTISCHRSDVPCGDCDGCIKSRRIKTAYLS